MRREEIRGERCASGARCGGFAVGVACLAALAGCINVDTIHEYRGGRALDPPDRVVVKDFAYAPDDASLASGPGARISHDADTTEKTAEEIELGRRVAAALSLKLVEKLLDLGVNAQRFDGQYPPFDNIVIIEGQFTSIDRGSRMARVVIGFGVGKSDVRTHVQVYQKTPSKRRLLQEFTTSATSSYTPGLVVGLGVGAVAGSLATSAVVSGGSSFANESFGADVAAGAERTATELVAKMKPFFIDQAWIPAYDG